jgi:hypothetical protein
MQELRFEAVVKKKVHIFGEDFECRQPSVFEQFEYEKEMQDKAGKDVIGVVLAYIERLGVPQSAAMKLTSDGVLDLVKFICSNDDKKK